MELQQRLGNLLKLLSPKYRRWWQFWFWRKKIIKFFRKFMFGPWTWRSFIFDSLYLSFHSPSTLQEILFLEIASVIPTLHQILHYRAYTQCRHCSLLSWTNENMLRRHPWDRKQVLENQSLRLTRRMRGRMRRGGEKGRKRRARAKTRRKGERKTS